MRNHRNSRSRRSKFVDSRRQPQGVWVDPNGDPHVPDSSGRMVPYQDPMTHRVNSGYQEVADDRVESQYIGQDNIFNARAASREQWDELYAGNPFKWVLSFLRKVQDDQNIFMPALRGLSSATAESIVQSNQSINSFHNAMIDSPRQAMEAQNALRIEGMGREMTRYHDGLDASQQMNIEYEQTRRLEDDALQRQITLEIIQGQNRLALLLAHNRTHNPTEVAVGIIKEVLSIGENLEPLTEGLSTADKDAISEITHEAIHKLITQQTNSDVLNALSRMVVDETTSRRPQVTAGRNSDDDER